MSILKHLGILAHEGILAQKGILYANGLLPPSEGFGDYYQWVFTGKSNEIVALDGGGYGYENSGTGGDAVRSKIKNTQVINIDTVNDGTIVLTAPIKLGNAFTIKFNGIPSSSTSTFRPIFSNDDALQSEGAVSLYKQTSTSSMYLALYPNGGSLSTIVIPKYIFDDTYHECELTYGNGNWQLIIDDDVYSGSITPSNGFTNVIEFGIYSRGWTDFNGGIGYCSYFSLLNEQLDHYIYDFQNIVGELCFNTEANQSHCHIKTQNESNLLSIKLDNVRPSLLIDGYVNYSNGSDDVNILNGLTGNNTLNQPPLLGVNEVPVLLPMGQSNASGIYGAKGYGIGNLPLDYQGEQTNIKIWWEGDYLTWNPANGAFVNMHPNINTVTHEYTNPASNEYQKGGWSIEQSCAHLLADYLSQDIYVINSSFGGLDIDNWESPAGVMWVELERYITNAIAEIELLGKTPKFYCAWMQGESDANAGSSPTYEAKLTSFINNFRGLSSYLTDAQLTIFMLSEGDASSLKRPINQAYRNVQNTLSNIRLSRTDNRTLWDNIHYDEDSNIKNGDEWFRIIASSLPRYDKISEIKPNAGFSNTGNTIDWVRGDAGLQALATTYSIPNPISFAQMEAIDFGAIPEEDLRVTFKDGVFTDWASEPYEAVTDNGEGVTNNEEIVTSIKIFK